MSTIGYFIINLIFYLVDVLTKLINISLVIVLLIGSYLALLAYESRKILKKSKQDLSYPMPAIKDPLFGHVEEFTRKDVEWHRRLGKIYAIFCNNRLQLKTSDLDLINEIFFKRNRLFNARVWDDPRFNLLSKGILFNKGNTWRRSRKLLASALAAYRIRTTGGRSTAFEDLNVGLDKLLGHFSAILTAPEDELAVKEYAMNQYDSNGYYLGRDQRSRMRFIEIKAYDMMQVITLDVIFRIGFNMNDINVIRGAGEPMLAMIKGWMSEFSSPALNWYSVSAAAKWAVSVYSMLFNRRLHEYLKFMTNLVKRDFGNVAPSRGGAKEKCVDSDEFAEDSMTTNGAGDDEQDSEQEPRRIYHVILDEYLQGRMPKGEAIQQLISFVIAGFETTATTSSYVLWCLAKYPEHQISLRADIRSQGIGSKQLDMFIKEVMRMFPALPHFVQRTPHADAQVGDYTIKRGMSVYLSVSAIHNDETIWPDPSRFDPSRFAEGKTHPPGAYAPFGLGHRMCAGYHLAMREMKTIVCRILTNFHIKLIAPDQMVTQANSIFLTRSKHDIKLRLIPLDNCQPAASEF